MQLALTELCVSLFLVISPWLETHRQKLQIPIDGQTDGLTAGQTDGPNFDRQAEFL
jgi:hypothetical protein